MFQYPAKDTIKAFGGFSALNAISGIPISTIFNWQKRGLVPPWRSHALEQAAEKAGVTLPKPRKVTRKRRAS